MRSVNDAGTSASAGVGTDRRSRTRPLSSTRAARICVPPTSAARTGRVTSNASCSGSFLSCLGRTLSGPVSRFAEETAEIRQLIGVDVLVALRVERLGDLPDTRQEVTLVCLLDGGHRLQEGEDRVPLDVVAQRVIEDLRQC